MSTSDRSEVDATELDDVVVSAGAAAALERGTRIGAYVIRHAIGEGGMGRVYLADQTAPVRREVALKLILEQFDSPFALVWFEVERQALATMQHPAIAQIFDAGTTEEGLAYLAMEFVEGLPVTDYCREHSLNRDQRLALFMRICQGVQHAHQKGVIHRDLKPANVLVRNIDGNALPKIIDFGIAIGGTSAGGGPVADMAASGRAGTAVYMSPEQADLRSRDIDTRSDVYSLGVMLFEMLTDHHASSVDSIAYRSRTVHTPRRSRSPDLRKPGDEALHAGAEALLDAAQELPFELQTLLRKALAADRNERYASAAALADDIERYREQRPLKAMTQTRAYLTQKFIARHRLGLFAAGVIVMALVMGAALALHGQSQARQSAEAAQAAAAKAEKTSEFVRNMLAGIDPDRARGMDNRLMHAILDSAAERVGVELSDQLDVRAEIERTIADSYASLGDYVLAQAHYQASIDSSRAANLEADEIARAEARAALNLENQGRIAEALQSAEKAFAMVEGFPPENRHRLSIEATLAGIEGYSGKPELARTRFLRILGLQRALFGNDSEDVLRTISDLAAVNIDTNQLEEAKALLEELLVKRREQYGEEHSKTLSPINGLAIIALEQKRYADAERMLSQQLPMVERVFGMDHPLTLRLISNLGGAIRQQDRNEDARQFYERAAALARKLYGANSPVAIIAESNLALLLRDSGDLVNAELHARLSTSNADVTWGNNAMRGVMYRELGTILVRVQKYSEAENTLIDAWNVLSNAEGYGPQHPRSQDVVDTFIELYQAWSKPGPENEWRSRKAMISN